MRGALLRAASSSLFCYTANDAFSTSFPEMATNLSLSPLMELSSRVNLTRSRRRIKLSDDARSCTFRHLGRSHPARTPTRFADRTNTSLLSSLLKLLLKLLPIPWTNSVHLKEAPRKSFWTTTDYLCANAVPSSCAGCLKRQSPRD